MQVELFAKSQGAFHVERGADDQKRSETVGLGDLFGASEVLRRVGGAGFAQDGTGGDAVGNGVVGGGIRFGGFGAVALPASEDERAHIALAVEGDGVVDAFAEDG